MVGRPTPQPRSRISAYIGGALAVLAIAVGLVLLSSAGIAYSAYSQLTDSLKPRLDAINNHDTFQTSRIYDRNGTLLYEFFGAGKRTRVPLDQISTDLISATIAIEDKTFLVNPGIDYEGIARTLYTSVTAGEETGGASTITQQLIKRVVLTEDERSYDNRYQRKMAEIILAQELSNRYTKKDILALYLNEIYYGNLAYGIEAAANVYFKTSAKDLTLPQAALLAGLPQLPNAYDPFQFTEGGALKGMQLGDDWLKPNYEVPSGTPPPKWRQIAVLRQMVDEGYVAEPVARRAIAEDLVFASQDVPLNAPHFVFYVRKLLEDQYGPEFANKGLSIYTSIDLDMQRMVQEKAAERIQELEERNIHNAAVVVMQPNTGEILAMVGSIDYNRSLATKTPGEKGNVLDGQVNVTVRERQPGSALKPFTYLSAMEHGMTPETVIWDVPTKFPLTGTEWYEPKNYNGRWNGPVRMRTALANSLNMPAVKALKFAGIDDTIDLLRRAGITGLRRGAGFYGLSLTLGGGEVTPLDLATAYNTLASGGRYYPPQAIMKIVDGDGKVIQEFKQTQRPQAIDADHVAIISNMLSDDKAREPIWGLNSKLKLSRPAAVKTGTSNDWRDAWAVGYTPYVTVGVWTGNNNNEPTAKVESLTGGGVIWHNVMEELFANPKFAKILAEPYQGGQVPMDFALPTDLVKKQICKLSGSFGNYNQELFSPDMLNPKAQPTPTGPQTNATTQQQDDAKTSAAVNGCSLYKQVTVAQLGDTLVRGSSMVSDTTSIVNSVCVPSEGQYIPPEMLQTVYTWNIPPSTSDEQISYRWDGAGGTYNGRPVLPMRSDQIPLCSNEIASEIIAEVAPPAAGALKMPDLRKLGENQAKEQLAAIGVNPANIYVDYQGRDRIPDIFDQTGAYVVVSTLPAPGEWIIPGTTVVLGIRSPE